MNDETLADELVLEYGLDAPPEKVWRALTVPELRAAWLPERDLADDAPLSSVPGEQIRYRMREAAPPHLESTVTFGLLPDARGGTLLRIVHAPLRREDNRTAANANGPPLMLAA